MLLEKLDLEDGEVILTQVRKHWFVIVSQLIGLAIGALVPLMLLTALFNLPSAFNGLSLHLEQYSSPIAFFIATWLLLSSISGFTIWTRYYLDLWVITDRRIIAIEQISFFNRSVGIFRLERMQDIEFSIKGLIQTFFNFGTLKAQTAGEEETNFMSDGMPNPDRLQGIIQKAMDDRIMRVEHNPAIH